MSSLDTESLVPQGFRYWDWCRLVIISQPVHQQAYETVVAAQQAGLLHTFRNGMYRTGRGLSNPTLLRLLPEKVRRAVDRQQRRRWHPEIDASKVSTTSRYHLVALAARPLRRVNRLPWDIERWAQWRFDAAVARSLPKIASDARIVHAWEGTALDTLRAARKLGLITILDVTSSFEYSVRAVSEEGGAPPGEELVRRIKRERELADFLFVPSEFVETCLIENGVESQRIIRIPYGVDPTTFAPEETLEPRPFRVLFAGQMGLRKGVKYLLEAWAKLRLPNAELVLVGSPDVQGLEIMRMHAGQYRHVPHMPLFELHHLFRSSDVFVFPSLAEGSALVTYMALAAGLPTVTTANAGSVLRDGVEGFLVPPRDAQAIGDRIVELFEHPELRMRMGAAARETVLGNYTWGHYRLRIASAYRGMLKGPGTRITFDPPLPVGV